MLGQKGVNRMTITQDDISRGSTGQKRQGFATLPPERLRQIASQGGKRAHELGKAHKFTSEEAQSAGSKGGKARHERWKAARG